MSDYSVSDSECVKAAEEVERVEREHKELQKALDEIADEDSAIWQSAPQHLNVQAKMTNSPGSTNPWTAPKTPDHFDNLLEKPLEPITSDICPARAPKKSRAIKALQHRYSRWSTIHLQEEYLKRFHPFSQKRMAERQFMEDALSRYDMEHASSTSSQSSTDQPLPKKQRCCENNGVAN